MNEAYDYGYEYKQYTCAECGEPCQVVTEDYGIGPYEYWGFHGVDVRLVDSSECCDAAVVEIA